MHPEADAFLDAIFNSPNDDTPRLVYAAWLQEHGQENYAQFIRLQCAAAHERPWSDAANRLWEEIGRVWNRLDEEWIPATREEWLFGKWDNSLLDAIHFHRGFPLPGLVMADEQLFRFREGEVWLPWMLPPSCSLVLTPLGNWKWLSSQLQLRCAAHLRLDRYEADWDDPDWLPDGITGLLSSPHLCNLLTLDLSDLLLTPRAVEVLLAAPNLASVRRLQVELSRDRGPDPAETVKQLEARFKEIVWVDHWDSE
ncbi:MAG: TIGR02996 domain-containing protein [Planctomycetes bacterium]|nr:TIGR02996 domain-containing protein [Planctomycetota bacterium]